MTPNNTDKKDVKKKSKKKRQPSFTLPKNPYKHHYGTSTPPPTCGKEHMVGTWTLLRSSSKVKQQDQGQIKKGFTNLNNKVSQNLDVEEIGSWMRRQKELYARHKRPPAVPKRSPETKLTASDIQVQEFAEIDGALPPIDYDEDETPESGYITPEQQGSELEYPFQSRNQHYTHGSPKGSVSSAKSPQHADNVHPSIYRSQVQAEIHCEPSNLNRGSVASLGSMPMLPPPPPPEGAMALQINPLHRMNPKHVSIASASTLLSSGSSSGTSGTLHDPHQPDDIYEHFIPHSETENTLLRRNYSAGIIQNQCNQYSQESNIYERTLPTQQNVSNCSNRPLPMPPGGQNHMMNHPGRNSMPSMANVSMTMPNQHRMSSHGECFPPPPLQFADNPIVHRSPTKQTPPQTMPKLSSPVHSGVDTSSNMGSLPFPVKLRSIGSPLMHRSGTAPSQCSDSLNNLLNTVVPTPGQKQKVAPHVPPKSAAVDIPPPPLNPSPITDHRPISGHFPPPPPHLMEPVYAEVPDMNMPPPPPLPPGGMAIDLVNRVQQWAINNEERTSRLSGQQNSHSALINQIQTGIKLRKSPFSNRLFELPHREEAALSPTRTPQDPAADYCYIDSIETCSVISGDSSSSGCHSISSHSNNSSSGSFPPHTLPKPDKNRTDSSTMPGNSQGNNTQRPLVYIDVTQLPGYQMIPPNCPAWKVSMIEKKNAQLESDARRKVSEQLEEEDRWKDIPEWKKQLILEKEKRKQDDEAPVEAERRRREDEMARLQTLPDWKRDLILKKRGDV